MITTRWLFQCDHKHECSLLCIDLPTYVSDRGGFILCCSGGIIDFYAPGYLDKYDCAPFSRTLVPESLTNDYERRLYRRWRVGMTGWDLEWGVPGMYV
jgi:hypothetical protein